MLTLKEKIEQMLIEDYGDQAYHKGIKLVAAAVKVKDMGFAKFAAEAVQSLMQKGYHKFEKEEK